MEEWVSSEPLYTVYPAGLCLLAFSHTHSRFGFYCSSVRDNSYHFPFCCRDGAMKTKMVNCHCGLLRIFPKSQNEHNDQMSENLHFNLVLFILKCLITSPLWALHSHLHNGGTGLQPSILLFLIGLQMSAMKPDLPYVTMRTCRDQAKRESLTRLPIILISSLPLIC